MKILKFGGTSIGSEEGIRNIAEIIKTENTCIIVLSAMAATTNALVEITDLLYASQFKLAENKVHILEKSYEERIEKLFQSVKFRSKAHQLVARHLRQIKNVIRTNFSQVQEKIILAQGELISTALFYYYLKENKIKSTLMPALNFMRIDRNGEPDNYYIQENLRREIDHSATTNLFITQGYICRNAAGEIDNLQRGGSDYTASLIGAAIQAEEVQIWTDIDGFHNNDPRFVDQTQALSELSFDEAAELAYFGAKIMHPASVLPCKLSQIPVRLKNTLNPEDTGTLISNKLNRKEVKAIAAKDGITAIKIKSDRMLLAHGFLRKVFEIFETHKTSIDMITTSEVAVSLTIDQTDRLNEIELDLNKLGLVEIDRNQSIICIVGDFISEKSGSAKVVLEKLEHIPLRMISYGGSEHNISVLVNQEYKIKALRELNTLLN